MANFSALKSVAKNDMPVPHTAVVDVDNHLQTFHFLFFKHFSLGQFSFFFQCLFKQYRYNAKNSICGV